MKRRVLLIIAILVQGCSSDDSATPAGGGNDASVSDATSIDSAPPDVAQGDAQGNDAELDAGCPSSWTVAPVTDPAIAVPDGGGGVVLHASASGTQDYTCTAAVADGGAADAADDASDAAPATSYSWVFVGPEAALGDCNAVVIGHHFASEAGAARPEWQTSDGTYVIGKKVAAVTIDGGNAIPWLLLQALEHGGTSTLSTATYVQRVNTTGGLAPSTACDGTTVGQTAKVAYTADYYFFGP